VAEDDHQNLWWTDARTFLEHVAAWFQNSDAGWADDRPDLDLDRYFHSANDDERLYLYGELDEYRNVFVRFAPDQNKVMRLKGRGTRPAKLSKKHLRDLFGYVADLGDIDCPPRNWDDIAAHIDPAVALEKCIREHKVGVLVLIYGRSERAAAIVLKVWPSTNGGIGVHRLRSAADTPAARSARAGPQSGEFSSRSAAVIGVGAVGSFLADMLVRAGIGRLTLVDGDVVTPGNLVRHLVGPETVGLPKPTAVKRHLDRIHGLDLSRISTRIDDLTAGDDALALLTEHDLVVNATADFAVTALFHVAAEAVGKSFLSVSLQNDGQTFRIDVLPPLAGAPMLPDSTAAPRTSSKTEYYEGGCGSPISPTSPHAVTEAAAVTVRHAAGLLLVQPVHPAGEVRHLNPGAVTI
jgi:hypothetical protein